MKKTVFIILAILPIFLIITISFAAHNLIPPENIEVEKVRFLKEDGTEYTQNDLLILEEGETVPTNAMVYPLLATNRKVSYASSNPEICSVDENGALTGVQVGTTTITVTTRQGGKTHSLYVQVRADKVTGVTLSHSELTLTAGDAITIIATVQGPAAQERNVVFFSDNPAVATVNSNGKISTLKEGTATITVRTREGGFTASCVVTVLPGMPALAWDFSEESAITATGIGYISLLTEIDLTKFIVYDPLRVDPATICYYVKAGGASGSITSDNVLVLDENKKGPVTVVAYVGPKDSPVYSKEVIITLPANNP